MTTDLFPVAVRALCEFSAKRGDLDLRFTPAPTALEGMEGHARVTSRRGDHYQREVSLSTAYGPLLLRGRADGYDPLANRLEEIKTYRGDLKRQPDNHRQLHWAQARVYAWLLCIERGLTDITVALVYYDVGSGEETLFTETQSAEALRRFAAHLCDGFIAWAEQERRHRQARDQALHCLRFPRGEFRAGQRQLAEAVYKAVHVGCCLMAQAPTGIGKTLGTLFPQLKAMPGQQLDRLFFLAAKTPGRRLALDALGELGRDQPLRCLELVARDKACEHPDKTCHGQSCPLAEGFYDRLPAARLAALSQPEQLDQAGVRAIALAHQVCPYYLAQELSRWCDVLVGDYNYYFDATAMLFGQTQQQHWRVAVLVDEAHNLVERARAMYSAYLAPEALAAAIKAAPAALGKPLRRVQRVWAALGKEHDADYRVLDQLPTGLLQALQQLIAQMGDYLVDPVTPLTGPTLQFYFDALQFTRLAERFDSHSLFDISAASSAGRRRTSLCIRNVVPAPFLAPRFAAARSVTLFSATLSPRRYHADTLGLPENTAWIDVPGPFVAEQLDVRLVPQVSTRYADRATSITPIADLLAQGFAQRPGNYLAFFSSFDYLRQVAERFAARHPHIPCWQQARGMDEQARAAFVARFHTKGRGIGFAVLGGAFGEGIDLPGERLVGAFVATLGLPQINPVNEEIRQRLQRTFGAGYDYTYLYPGLTKVIQAAGRVIRTREDRGALYLIDDRFSQARVRELLPAWWRPQRLDDALLTDPGAPRASLALL